MQYNNNYYANTLGGGDKEHLIEGHEVYCDMGKHDLGCVVIDKRIVLYCDEVQDVFQTLQKKVDHIVILDEDFEHPPMLEMPKVQEGFREKLREVYGKKDEANE
jgi:hypothetical protein